MLTETRISLKSFVFHLFLLGFLFPSGFASGQSRPDSISYLKSYLTNTVDLVAEPFKWDKYDLANLTLSAGAAGFLMIYDEKIDDLMLRNQNSSLTKLSENVIGPFGSGLYSLPLLGVVYVGGVVGKNSYDKEMAMLGLKAFIFAAGGATMTKFAFQRHRPLDDDPPNAFVYEGPFGSLGDDGSFVSRHATTSFAIATVMAEGYKSEKKWVPFAAYTLASLVTVSRVYERKHWASDAFTGAVLGYVTGKFLYYINHGYKQKKSILRKTNMN